MRAFEGVWGSFLEAFGLHLGLVLGRFCVDMVIDTAQRVQLDCHYGIRAQKTYMAWFFGPNS